MNIITVTYNSDFFYIRPDISLNRDGNDYFCPDNITEIAVAPFIYIRIDKAGKSIQSKFAHRYYSSIGYGVNLSGQSLIDNNIPQSFLMANALDNTTYISQLYHPDEFPLEKLVQEFQNTLSAENGTAALLNIFNKKIEQITSLSSVRTGDLIALELAYPVQKELNSSVKFGEIEFMIR